MISCVAIDDDPLFLRLLDTYFEEMYDAILLSSWGNPVKGALAIAKQRPEVVLLDYDMPYMDGFKMLELLEEKPKVIIISGRLKEAEQAELKADFFIPKSSLTSATVLQKAILEVVRQ
ncbi:MAG: response regulator [Cyclobacteriaceae bacterium]